MAFIYLATWSDGSVYVGQTNRSLQQLTGRYSGYSGSKRKTKRPCEMACRLYGVPTLRILETCAPADLDNLETFWIHEFMHRPKCLNVMQGKGQWLSRLCAWEAAAEQRIEARVKALLGLEK